MGHNGGERGGDGRQRFTLAFFSHLFALAGPWYWRNRWNCVCFHCGFFVPPSVLDLSDVSECERIKLIDTQTFCGSSQQARAHSRLQPRFAPILLIKILLSDHLLSFSVFIPSRNSVPWFNWPAQCLPSSGILRFL